MAEIGDITTLLRSASAGDPDASNELFETVYHELRNIARAHRRNWHGNETLNTSALINEAYMRLAGKALPEFRDRTHFYATAARAMRQILINYAERVTAAKRGGNAMRVTLSGLSLDDADTLDELLHIDQLLGALEKSNVRHCRLVECRVFGGMTIDETAAALEVSPATVKRDWAVVSAWLFSEIKARKKP